MEVVKRSVHLFLIIESTLEVSWASGLQDNVVLLEGIQRQIWVNVGTKQALILRRNRR